MKKILLSIINFLACMLSMNAQTLYGTTNSGGNYGGGSIYKFIPATNNLIVVKSWATQAGSVYTNLIQATDGKLYGMTKGDREGSGFIFSYNPLDSTYTQLNYFDGINGADPQGSLIQASDGKLYGMTTGGGINGVGVIFSYDPLDSIYTKLKDFNLSDGFLPQGSLMQASDGKLYGMAKYGGSRYYVVIFSFDPADSIYTKLKVFEGGEPLGSLVQGSDGNLYGMTTYGGSKYVGVIFSFDPLTSNYIKLVDFDSTNGYHPYGSLIQASNGKLYGMTSVGGSKGDGVIFSFDPLVSTFTKLVDLDSTLGANPFGTLIQASDGKLYGMTQTGGNLNAGVVFSYDPSASSYTKLMDFGGNGSGYSQGSLMQAKDGKLYGLQNGQGGYLQIFSFNPSTSAYDQLYDFQANVGHPSGTLMQASDGKIYGTTILGGHGSNGSIYSFDPSSSTYTNLKDFDYTNEGGFPYGGLIQADDKKLYGMTRSGGPSDGVLFSFDPSNSKYTNLIDIGGRPWGGLIQASDKKLYGMTHSDGGTIFSYAIQSSTYTILMTFTGRAGNAPYGSLIQARDGKLYGMTAVGGGQGYGVIFSYDPSCFIFKKVKDFNSTDGAYPYGSLVEASDGKLYGLTSEGGSDKKGVIFSYDPSTANYTKLKDFNGNGNGANPRGSLMQASDGKLYGTTNGGGSSGTGVIFSFDPSSSTYTKLKDYGNATDFDNALIELKECVTETTWYKDADGDGYGNPAFRLKACTQPPGYTTNNTDCDDNDNTMHTRVTYYRDLDLDGYGDSFNSLSFCSNVLPPPGYVTNNYDCYDSGTVSHPEYVRVRMCHDRWTQCVNASEIPAKLGLGWTLGPCALQSCAADETLLCHNGRQECVKTKYVPNYLAEPGGKWSRGPLCSGTPIFRSSSNKIKYGASPVMEPSMPTAFRISNYPNPFSETSTIYYELPLDSKVSIKVYDLVGRLVATLVDEYKKAGIYTVNINADRLSSGTLYYRIVAKSKDQQFQQTNQMIKIK